MEPESEQSSYCDESKMQRIKEEPSGVSLSHHNVGMEVKRSLETIRESTESSPEPPQDTKSMIERLPSVFRHIFQDEKTVTAVPTSKRQEKSDRVKMPYLRPLPDLSWIDKDRFKDCKLMKYKKERNVEIEYRWRIRERMKDVQRMFRETKVECTCYKGPPRKQEYYLNILRQCAESAPKTFTMQQKWVKHIRRYIPDRLKQLEMFDGILEEEISGLKEKYETEIRKPVVKDASLAKKKKILIESTPVKVSKEMRKRYRNSYRELGRKLYMIHGIVQKVQKICDKHFIGNSVANFTGPSFQKPMTIPEFHETVLKECERKEFILMNFEWWPEIVKVFEDHKKVLDSYKRGRRESLFNSSNALIRYKGKEIIQQTIDDYMSSLKLNRNRKQDEMLSRPVIKVSLLIENNEISSNPTLIQLENGFLDVLSILNNCFSKLYTVQFALKQTDIPKKVTVSVENKPYVHLRGRMKTVLDPILDELKEIMQSFATRFEAVVSKEAHDYLHQVVVEETPFDELVQIENKYRAIRSEVTGLLTSDELSAFSLDYSPMKQGLLGLTEKILKVVCTTMTNFHRKENKRICALFKIANSQLLRRPENTTSMFEQMSYSRDFLNEKYPELLEQVKESGRRMLTLLETTDTSLEDMELNCEVQLWPMKLRPAILECDEILRTCKSKCDENLKQQRDHIYAELKRLKVQVLELEQNKEIGLLSQYNKAVTLHQKNFNNLLEKIKWVNNEEELFKYDISKYPLTEQIQEELEPYVQLYGCCASWERTEKKWLDGPLANLKAVTVENKLKSFHAEALRLQKVFKNIWKNKALQLQRSAKEDEPFHPMSFIENLIQNVTNFKQYQPVINTLCAEGLKTRHWEEMSTIIGERIRPDASMTLRKMLNMEVEKYLNKFESVIKAASKEHMVEKSLEKMQSEWNEMNFIVLPYHDVFLLGPIAHVQTLLDEQIIKTQAMQGSRFAKPFAKDIEDWLKLLKLTQVIVDEMTKVQAQWLNLYPVFTAEDVKQRMPSDSKLFQTVDTAWKSTMVKVQQKPLVLDTANTPDMLEVMQTCSSGLDKIKYALNVHMEEKRMCFPRFFFLSKEELLEIFSETQDPLHLQPYVKKMFEGIAAFDVDDELVIHGILGHNEESIPFVNGIDTKLSGGLSEKWLLEVQENMKVTLQETFANAFQAYETVSRNRWLVEYPGQVVLCISQIYWTSQVHQTIRGGGHKGLLDFHEQLQQQLSKFVDLVRGKLVKQARVTLCALVVLEVHARDVVKELGEKGVNSERDFKWLAQLRYYWEEETVQVRIINAAIKYSYEYLGSTSRLVITPLTDRFRRTIIGAYNLHLFGAVEGTTSYGKTETVKDLSKIFAVHCVVFNCSENVDCRTMKKFLKGLFLTGAWACFDDFNTIKVEVLSVISQQMQSITNALQAGANKITFEGLELDFNRNCYVCVTMNLQYIGRSELPDSLKALFRTVCFTTPNFKMITKIMLYSSGFLNASNLAKKIVTVLRLCSEQFSVQRHYDFGMRTLRGILTIATNLRLKNPEEDESRLIMQAIVEENLPKLLPSDIPEFNTIMFDIFPKVEPAEKEFTEFTNAAKKACKELNLQSTENFIHKINQTYETMNVHHGIILVGNPLSGKTSILKVLARTLSLLKDGEEEGAVLSKTINQKALSIEELFGHTYPHSNEWKNGIVSLTLRNFSSDESSLRQWVIFDGPIDSLWIDNLNTLLDDNKRLCVVNGEIIYIRPTTNVIFEVMDLSHASPSIISRCGVIYCDASTFGFTAYVKSWMTTLPEEWKTAKDMMEIMINWLIPPCFEFLETATHKMFDMDEMNLVKNTLEMTLMLLQNAYGKKLEGVDQSSLLPWFNGLLLTSTVWTFGGMLLGESKQQFENLIKQLLSGKVSTPKKGRFETRFPTDGNIYDYMFQPKGKGMWKSWKEFLPGADVQLTPTESFVPTVNTVRYGHFIEICVNYGRSVILIGPSGSGKTIVIDNSLKNKLKKDVYISQSLCFSSHITTELIQNVILSSLEKKRKDLYGPSSGKKCVYFIDDINSPCPQECGAQPPLELLRQYLDHGFWFDLKNNMDEIQIVGLQFIAAMQTPRVDRNKISSRLLRHFYILCVEEIDKESLTRIFSTITNSHFMKHEFPTDIYPAISKIMEASLDLYQNILSHLLPVPSKLHYMFSMKDISRMIIGICLLKKKSIPEKKTLYRLWTHEVYRVFCDRIDDDDDYKWFFRLVKRCVNDYFNEDFNALFSALSEGNITENDMKRLLFGTYMDTASMPGERFYEEVVDVDTFKAIVLLCLKEYNKEHSPALKLVVFMYVLMHISRISRILAIDGANALLLGIGGSGRETITKLASYMEGYTVFQPETSENFGETEWYTDIKNLLKKTGAYNERTVFFLKDFQFKQSSFFEDISSLLKIGKIPNLFSMEDKQEITEAIQPGLQAKDRMADFSLQEIMSYFIQASQKHLRIVISMSPVEKEYRRLLQQYPSLINYCSVNWFREWPDEALELIALTTFKDLYVEPKVKSDVVEVCKYIHNSAKELSEEYLKQHGRPTYITSAQYMNMLVLYCRLMDEKQQEVAALRDRYKTGVKNVKFASEQRETLAEEIEKLKPLLQAADEERQRMFSVIERAEATVERQKKIVSMEENVVNEQSGAIEALKEEIRINLEKANPAFEDAYTLLEAVKPTDVRTIKVLKRPTPDLKLMAAALCLLMRINPVKSNDPKSPKKKVLDYWAPAISFLENANFVEEIKNLDRSNISALVITKLRNDYFNNKDLKPKKLDKASPLVKGLYKWIMAVRQYDNICTAMQDTRNRLENALDRINMMETALELKRSDLEDVVNRHAQLIKEYESSEIRLKLEEQSSLSSQRWTTAVKLVDGLEGELEKWSSEAEKLDKIYSNLPGDVLLSSATISYLGPFTEKYRMKYLKKWAENCSKNEISCTENFSLTTTLGKEEKLYEWNMCALPCDKFSNDNAVIVEKTYRCPLLIDPQHIANTWIKRAEKSRNLRVHRMSDRNLLRTLQDCVPKGIPVLIENVGEELSFFLIHLIRKVCKSEKNEKSSEAGKTAYKVKIGDQVVTCNPNFKLYLTTKLDNPHYYPEALSKVTLINFVITTEALENRLISITMTEEQPDLDQERQALIVQKAENSKTLAQVEEKILDTLYEEENVLDNVKAVQVLESTKTITEEIIKKQKALLAKEENFESILKEYMPVARHSSVVFFCINSLSAIEPSYHYSLNWFLRLFVASILKSNKSRKLDKRLRYINDHLTYSVYCNVCFSLFEKDKLILSFLLCCHLLMAHNQLNDTELQVFLTGGPRMETKRPKPASWIPDKAWERLRQLEALPKFKHFISSFEENMKAWNDIYENKEPYNCIFPSPWQENLNEFEKMMIMHSLRPDKDASMISRFVKCTLGEKFIHPPLPNIELSFEESDQTTPIVFIVSAGSSPMNTILKFAHQKGFGNTCEVISMGQDQGPTAEAVIQSGRLKGNWVVLQNCHLAPTWVPRLENIYDDITVENTHRDFRLWVTMYPFKEFPTAVLQTSVKIVSETPCNLQENLLRSYLNYPLTTSGYFSNDTSVKQSDFEKLIFGLCFFHAIVLERKRYGFQGWNVPYDFDESDLQLSLEQLKTFSEEYNEMLVEAISYVTGECIYGGRVADEWDRRCLLTILNDYCNISVIRESKYSLSRDGLYYIPDKMSYSGYIEFLKKLPETYSPETFGLNNNIEIARELQGGTYLLDSAILIYCRKQHEVPKSKEIETCDTASAILEKLPSKFDVEEARAHYPQKYRDTMNVILINEMEAYNKLLRLIEDDLDAVRQALRGNISMTDSLQETANSIFCGKMPELWRRISYPSRKPLSSYIINLAERAKFFKDWFFSGKPRVLWFPGFYNPQALLTATLLNSARNQGCPYDKLTFDNKIMKSEAPSEYPDGGIFISGLFLEGAKWEKKYNVLVEQPPRALWDKMPAILLKPVLKSNIPVQEHSRYRCPTYNTSERHGTVSTTGQSTNFVLAILIPTKKPPEHWIKCGVALLCQLDK